MDSMHGTGHGTKCKKEAEETNNRAHISCGSRPLVHQVHLLHQSYSDAKRGDGQEQGIRVNLKKLKRISNRV